MLIKSITNRMAMSTSYSQQLMKFSTLKSNEMYNPYVNDPNKNRYQETQMLFFQDKQTK
jgi:hypothetical protein